MAEREEKLGKRTISILIIDDTPTELCVLIAELKKNHYTVYVAESGRNALERVRYIQPDIILLDVLMPEIDGFATCIQLKKDPFTNDVPVLFLSELDESIDKVRGFAVGGVDYITKPFQVIEVLARIRTHLTLRHVQQTLEEKNQSLEEMVAERTAQLQAEVAHRLRQEEQKRKLLDELERQSDQLSGLMKRLIEQGKTNEQGVNEQVIAPLTKRSQQLQQKVEHLQAITNTLTNAPERHRIVTQLHQLHNAIEQLKEELQTIRNALSQPSSFEVSLEDPLIKLSAREREVLQLIVDGNTNTEIAELLYISETTVRSHRSRLLQKLQIEDTTALIKFALQHQLTTL